MDISITQNLGHGRCIRRSEENDSGNLFTSSFLHKYENPLTRCRIYKYNTFQEIRTGTPESIDVSTVEVLSSQRGSAELVRAVTGGGAFSNANHLRTLSEKRRYGNKYRDAAYETKLKGLVRNLKGTDKRLILRDKITGAWLSVHSTTVSGTFLSAT